MRTLQLQGRGREEGNSLQFARREYYRRRRFNCRLKAAVVAADATGVRQTKKRTALCCLGVTVEEKRRRRLQGGEEEGGDVTKREKAEEEGFLFFFAAEREKGRDLKERERKKGKEVDIQEVTLAIVFVANIL